MTSHIDYTIGTPTEIAHRFIEAEVEQSTGTLVRTVANERGLEWKSHPDYPGMIALTDKGGDIEYTAYAVITLPLHGNRLDFEFDEAYFTEASK